MLPIRSQAAEFFPSSVAVKIDQKVLFVDQCNEAPLLIDILQDRSMEGHAFHSAAVASLQAAPCGFRSSGTVAQLRSEKS